MLQLRKPSRDTFIIFLEACIVAVFAYSLLVTFVMPGITGYLLSGPAMDDIQESCPDCFVSAEQGEEVPLMANWIFLVLVIMVVAVIVYKKRFARSEPYHFSAS